MHSALAQICPVLICGASGESDQAARAGYTERCGPIEIHHYAVLPELDYSNWSTEIWNSLAQATGIFRTIYEAFRLIESKGRGGIAPLLRSVDGDIGVLRALPNHLNGFLPETDWETDPSHIDWEKVLEDDAFLREGDITSAREVDISAIEDGESGNWDKFFERYTWIALNYLAETPFHHHSASEIGGYFKRPEGALRLASACLHQPYTLRQYPELWGKLLSCAPGLEQNLRSAFCVASGGPVGSKGYITTLHPFEIRLPDEAGLLPHILDCCVERIPWYRHADDDPGGRVRNLRAVEQSVIKYLPDPAPLEPIISNEELKNAVRAAAAALYMLHPQCNLALQPKCETIMVKLYSADIGSWYLRSAATALGELIFKGDPGALSTIGGLFQAGRTDFEGRLNLDPVLDNWRQKSRAPVQAAIGQLWESSN